MIDRCRVADDVVEILGAPYLLGGRSVKSGMDCLAVVLWTYAAQEIILPDITRDSESDVLAEHFRSVDIPHTGDVVYWKTGTETEGHAGVYIERSGVPYIVHAWSARGVYCDTLRKVLRFFGNPDVRYFEYTGLPN